MCFHASEKLLSDTAVPLFPSYTPSLEQLLLAARSHDPPMLLPAFTLSSAWIASEKQRPALSPTLAFLLSIVDRLVNTSPGPWLHPVGFSQNLARQMTTKRKKKICFPLFPSSSSSFPLDLLCDSDPQRKTVLSKQNISVA